MSIGTKAIEPFYYFVADSKDFHSGRIVPQKYIPGKGRFYSTNGYFYETDMLRTFR